MSVWYQVEFYSALEQRWVPLFGIQKSEAEAQAASELLANSQRKRIVKVTHTTEVVSDGQ